MGDEWDEDGFADEWGDEGDLKSAADEDVDMTGDVKTEDADGFGGDEYEEEDDSWDDGGGEDDWGDDDDKKAGAGFGTGPISDFPERTDIPDLTFKTLSHNCVEINMLPMFAAVPDLKSRARIGAVIGIKIDQLSNITEEQLEVWNITEEYNYIAAKLEFGPFYLGEAELPKIQVGMSKGLSVVEPLDTFRLSWTILERTKNVMLSPARWPPDGISMKDIPNASVVNDLMEMSGCEFALCLEAVKKAGGDKMTATSYLMDESMKRKLQEKLPSAARCRDELKEIVNSISQEQILLRSKSKAEEWSDTYSSASDMKKASQLAEAFGFGEKAAALMIKELGYDLACSRLSADLMGSRSEYEAKARSLASVAGESDDLFSTMGVSSPDSGKSGGLSGMFGGIKSMFGGKRRKSDEVKTDDLAGPGSIMRTLSDGQINMVAGEDIQRTMAVMMRHNFLLRILVFMLKVLMNGNKFCMICDQQLEFAGLKPSICTAPFCQFRHDQIGLGFSLSSEILHRIELTDLLVSCCYAACLNRRIEIFFPEAVRGVDEFSEESLMDATGTKPDVEKLKTVLCLCPPLEDLKDAARGGDLVLKSHLKSISPLLYPLLVWIVTSNRSHLRKLKPEEEITGLPQAAAQFTLASATPAKEAEFQRIQATNGSFLAFHGSPMGNWHSICRMGLKNYSRTKHQMHGAAYGSGIYLAENFSYSVNYCKYQAKNSWPNSRFGDGLSCMALCEVCYHDDDVGKGLASKSASAVDPSKLAGSTRSSRKYTPATDTRKGDSRNKWKKTNGIYVVDREECVITRFFLVYKGQMESRSVPASTLSIPQVVKSS